MSVFSVADFTVAQSALPTQYAELVNCVQRLAPMVRTLMLGNGTTGNTINYDVKLGGKTASTANLDGGNLPTATADVRRGVSLPYGSYAAGMQLTDRLRRVDRFRVLRQRDEVGHGEPWGGSGLIAADGGADLVRLLRGRWLLRVCRGHDERRGRDDGECPFHRLYSKLR
jgi:hypothetical protein